MRAATALNKVNHRAVDTRVRLERSTAVRGGAEWNTNAGEPEVESARASRRRSSVSRDPALRRMGGTARLLDFFELRFLPSAQPRPQVFGIDIEELADILERERPLRVVLINPLLGFPKQALSAASLRIDVLHEGIDRVFQHGEHKKLLAFHQMLAAHRLVILARQ